MQTAGGNLNNASGVIILGVVLGLTPNNAPLAGVSISPPDQFIIHFQPIVSDPTTHHSMKPSNRTAMQHPTTYKALQQSPGR
jgi:hypothetical protein